MGDKLAAEQLRNYDNDQQYFITTTITAIIIIIITTVLLCSCFCFTTSTAAAAAIQLPSPEMMINQIKPRLLLGLIILPALSSFLSLKALVTLFGDAVFNSPFYFDFDSPLSCSLQSSCVCVCVHLAGQRAFTFCLIKIHQFKQFRAVVVRSNCRHSSCNVGSDCSGIFSFSIVRLVCCLSADSLHCNSSSSSSSSSVSMTNSLFSGLSML